MFVGDSGCILSGILNAEEHFGHPCLLFLATKDKWQLQHLLKIESTVNVDT